MGKFTHGIDRTSGMDEVLDALPADSVCAGDEQLYIDVNFLPVEFRTQSSHVAHDIIEYICRHDNPSPPPDRASATMRSLVDDLLRSRLDSMRHLVNKLDMHDHAQLQILHSITTAMFEDQVVTWGRVVTLHAFCAYLARYCMERGVPHFATDIADILCVIVVNRLGLWIVANGGWDAFEKQFPLIGPFDGGSFWKGLTLIGLIGGAAVAFYTAMNMASPSSD